MIRGFQEFWRWMMEHNIDPDHFEIVIEAKTPEASSKVRFYMGRDFDACSLLPEAAKELMDRGQINNLTFRIEDKWK